MIKSTGVVFVLVTALAACGGGASPSTTAADLGSTTTATSVPTGPGPGVPPSILVALVDDASRRLGIDVGAVEVLSSESVTWSDGSLGCPEPGMFYTQAL
ncbi:MAG: hypothetical protein WAL25_16145, partial [Acidimicrobiia bacterium]